MNKILILFCFSICTTYSYVQAMEENTSKIRYFELIGSGIRIPLPRSFDEFQKKLAVEKIRDLFNKIDQCQRRKKITANNKKDI